MDFNNKKEVLEKYPWLTVRNRWSDEVVEDITEFDIMEVPQAWKDSFIPNLIEELDQLLKKVNFVDEYRITQVKEKYGILHWYDNGFPEQHYSELEDIIERYREISEYTCVVCGKYDPKEVRFCEDGWISAYCKEHMK